MSADFLIFATLFFVNRFLIRISYKIASELILELVAFSEELTKSSDDAMKESFQIFFQHTDVVLKGNVKPQCH